MIGAQQELGELSAQETPQWETPMRRGSRRTRSISRMAMPSYMQYGVRHAGATRTVPLSISKGSSHFPGIRVN